MADDDRYPSQLAERFQVRLPDGMRDRLKVAAEANKRSMNTEIVARLEVSLTQQADPAILFAKSKADIAGAGWPIVAREVSTLNVRVEEIVSNIQNLTNLLNKDPKIIDAIERVKELEKRCVEAEAEVGRQRAQIDALQSLHLAPEAIEAQLARLQLATSARTGRSGGEGQAPDPIVAQWLQGVRAAAETSSKGVQAERSPLAPSITDPSPESLAKAKLPKSQGGDTSFANLMDRLNDLDASLDAEVALMKMRRVGPGNKDYSIKSFIGFLERFTDQSPDLKPLWDAKWPYRFSDLPADTRAALIGALHVDAPGFYEAFVSPLRHGEKSEPLFRPSGHDLLRGKAMGALRRLQRAFLPAESPADDGGGRANESPDEVDAAARRARR